MRQVTIPCVHCEVHNYDWCYLCKGTKKYSPYIAQEGYYAWIDHPFTGCAMDDIFRQEVLKYVNYLAYEGYECVGSFQYGSKWLFKCTDVGKYTMTVAPGRTFP